MKNYKLYTFFAMFYVACLLTANIVNSKLIEVYGYVFVAGILIFPISFILGDILTEVYGYKETRKIIWGGFLVIILITLFTQIIINVPSPVFYADQASFEKIFGSLPRIVCASLLAYFCGEFANSTVLSKMKLWSNGKNLWMRTIGSTIVGEGVDTVVFATVALYGVVGNHMLISIIASGYIFKVCYEVIATPLTYKIVAWVKKVEGVDQYDHGVKYNPFKFD